MSEYNENISRKTWSRSIEPVAKIGYMNGASDGQTAVFQESFNVGYKQGFTFGLELGFSEAMSSVHQKGTSLPDIEDQRRINCQICTNAVKAQENIGNLYNIQQEKNTEYLLRCNKDGFCNDQLLATSAYYLTLSYKKAVKKCNRDINNYK